VTPADPAVVVVVVVVAAVLGLAVGSFLNVVIWRVPRGESVLHPASACPRCGHPIRRFDNVPVVSWLVLRGRCRDCRAPIAVRYPVVELVTGVAFAAIAWWRGSSWSVPALCYLAAVSIALVVIDVEHRRLPDAIVLPSYPIGAALLVLATFGPGEDVPTTRLLMALVGAAAMFAVYFLLMVVYPSGMGFGDVKLAGVLGMYLGWVGGVGALVVGFFAGFLLGGLYSLALILARRAGRRTAIAFGPWMVAGAWLGLAAGAPIWESYLSLVL
jgi:leader peptidase (prepilin peptidase)/N-methyltransferase